MELKLPVQLIADTSSITPYPTRILRHQKWLPFVRTNGYAALARRLKIKVYSDLESAQILWEYFSPHESLFDLWEVRRAFFDTYTIQPYFLTIYEQQQDSNNILGVLPLWLDEDDYKGKYSWCGGYWPEDNVFFVKDPEVIPLLLMAAPNPLELHCVKPFEEYEFLKDLPGYKTDDKKFYLNLAQFKSIEEYLMSLKKKKRHNVRRDTAHIERFSPRIEFGRIQYLDRLFELNIERFHNKQNDESIFEHAAQRNLFRRLISSAQESEPYIMTTTIAGAVEAVEVGFIYNDVCYALSSGANVGKYSGIGVFSNLKLIEEMMKRGIPKIDFLEGDYNWKSSWQLDSYTSFCFIK